MSTSEQSPAAQAFEEGGPWTVGPASVPAVVRTRGVERPRRSTFAVVGSGWRALAYLRLGHQLPDLFEAVGVVTRGAEAGARVEAEHRVPAFRTLEELLAHRRPDLVVLSVPWPVTPDLIRAAVAVGLPVLAETPPAPDVEGMRALWADVGAAGLVQVAEQYPLMPLHAARAALVRDGTIGAPGSAHVSSTHLYHAVALMRSMLGVDVGPVRVSATTAVAPLVDPITPAGWTHDAAPKPARTVLAALDLGDGRSGLYDFTDNQWWNPLRPDHLAVRGSHGEIHDEDVVRMADATTPVASRIERRVAGFGMHYEGLETTHLSFDGRVVWRNRFEGGGLTDDELGTAQLVAATGAWARGEGPAPYPLRDGLHDHRVGIAIEQAAAGGQAVEVGDEPWT